MSTENWQGYTKKGRKKKITLGFTCHWCFFEQNLQILADFKFTHSPALARREIPDNKLPNTSWIKRSVVHKLLLVACYGFIRNIFCELKTCTVQYQYYINLSREPIWPCCKFGGEGKLWARLPVVRGQRMSKPAGRSAVHWAIHHGPRHGTARLSWVWHVTNESVSHNDRPLPALRRLRRS